MNIGIIGFGYIGKRHAKMIAENKNFDLVCICDIKNKSDIQLNEYKNIPYYNSLTQLFKSHSNIDAFVVSTPNGFHEENSIQILKNNCHVIIEKPMALTSKGCQKILNSAKKFDRNIFCVMQNRHSPPSRWLKSLLKNRTLGEIYLVQINCFWNRDDRYYDPIIEGKKTSTWHGDKKLDGGTLFTQFSHFIDLMFWFFGDIINVRSKLRDFNHKKLTEFEDSGIINFDFKDGGIGSLNFSTSVWEKNLESSITVIGEKGSLKVGGQYMNEVEYCNIENYEMPILEKSNPPNDYGTYKGSASNHHYIYNNINNYFNKSEEITTTGFEGFKVVEIIEKMYNSI